MSLTIEQVRTVRSTVPALQAHGDEITALFYKTLLEEYPELHNVFNQTNQISGAQPKALASALFAYATHIDDLGALSPAVERICQKHASLYIQPAQYELVGKYLLQAFGEVLGAALTKEVFDACTLALVASDSEVVQVLGIGSESYSYTSSWFLSSTLTRSELFNLLLLSRRRCLS